MKKILNEDLNRKSVDEFKQSEKSPYVVILDNIRSMNNVGSVFRTSDAFLCEKVFLCGITPKPPHRDIQKTALGATESVDWEYFENTKDVINKLKAQNYIVASIEQVEKAVLLNEFLPKSGKKYAFVFGHEVKGVDQKIVDISDLCLEIPQVGTKHSLNISVSVGVVLWDFVVKSNKI
ncbi:MAG: RNA methyltransferase [Bacteroidales bacterium]|nr:RNA methyltransferase [Bacteroidales bacterium]